MNPENFISEKSNPETSTSEASTSEASTFETLNEENINARKEKHKRSAMISLIITRIVIICAIVTIIFIPDILREYSKGFGMSDQNLLYLRIFMYMCAVPAFIVLFTLDHLLRNIRKEEVFTRENIKLLSRLSWGCFIASGIALGFFFIYRMLIFIVISIFLIGLMLRVVKNAFEEAVIIKEENDYTI